jgi:hypothetical protein
MIALAIAPMLYTRFSDALERSGEIFPLFPQVALRISLTFLQFPDQKILDEFHPRLKTRGRLNYT